jgi:hypothetical protein
MAELGRSIDELQLNLLQSNTLSAGDKSLCKEEIKLIVGISLQNKLI